MVVMFLITFYAFCVDHKSKITTTEVKHIVLQGPLWENVYSILYAKIIILIEHILYKIVWSLVMEPLYNYKVYVY